MCENQYFIPHMKMSQIKLRKGSKYKQSAVWQTGGRSVYEGPEVFHTGSYQAHRLPPEP